MDKNELFDYTFEKIRNSSITAAVAERVMRPGYDRALGAMICEISFNMQNRDTAAYDLAIEAFIEFSYDFLRLQVELEETGHYRHQTFEQVARDVYLDTKLMQDTYMKGLLLTEAFWVNHAKILQFFMDEFCSGNKKSGTVMEVPVGTGIFISEFSLRNPGWDAVAFDLSDGAVAFSKELMQAVTGFPSEFLDAHLEALNRHRENGLLLVECKLVLEVRVGRRAQVCLANQLRDLVECRALQAGHEITHRLVRIHHAYCLVVHHYENPATVDRPVLGRRHRYFERGRTEFEHRVDHEEEHHADET